MHYLSLYLFLAAICLYGIRFAPANMDLREIMNRLNRLRPIVAVLLIFGHCTLPYAKIPLILLPFHKASTFCVGYFFVLSGYGLAYSVDNKPGYLHNFRPKVLHLVWITAFSSIVSVLLQSLAFQEWVPLRLINWYMLAIIVLYLTFYMVYRLFPDSRRKRVLCLFAAVFLLISAVCFYGKLVGRNYRNYFISEMAFPFGAWLYEYAEEFSAFLKKKYALPIILLAGVLFNAGALIIPELGLPDLILHNLMLAPFLLLVIWILDKLSIQNSLLKKASPYTTFLYLFQFPVLNILKHFYDASGRPIDLLYFWGCLGLTCLLAVGLQSLSDAARAGMHRLQKH